MKQNKKKNLYISVNVTCYINSYILTRSSANVTYNIRWTSEIGNCIIAQAVMAERHFYEKIVWSVLFQ